MELYLAGLQNQENLIEGVKLLKLKVNRDPSGILVETLKSTWNEVYGSNLPFAQSYYSVTPAGLARDEDRWHVHPTKQLDRFVVLKGNAVFALYDWREDSKTFRKLNLFLMGEKNGDNNQFLLLVPKNVLHGFCSVGNEPCYLLNYPTTLYDKEEEGRIPFSEIKAKFSDNTLFSWQVVRDQFTK